MDFETVLEVLYLGLKIVHLGGMFETVGTAAKKPIK